MARLQAALGTMSIGASQFNFASDLVDIVDGRAVIEARGIADRVAVIDGDTEQMLWHGPTPNTLFEHDTLTVDGLVVSLKRFVRD